MMNRFRLLPFLLVCASVPCAPFGATAFPRPSPRAAFSRPQSLALIQAAKAGDDKAAHAALLAGADPNAGDVSGATALQYAGLGVLTLGVGGLSPGRHLDLVKDLLEHGADSRAVKARHFADKIVSQSLYTGRYDVARLLLGRGQGGEQRDFYWLLGDRPPGLPARDAVRRRVFDLLLRRWPSSDRFLSVLVVAVRAEDGGYFTRRLIERGADPNARLGDGSTVLIEAVRGGRADAVTVLLKAGADPSLPYSYFTPAGGYVSSQEEARDGRTPLSFAADGGTGTIFNILRRAGAKP